MPSAESGLPANVPQFYGHEMFEHYQEDGYLIVVTSDATAIRLKPGDFIVKRVWSTAVVPYVYNRAANTVLPPGESQLRAALMSPSPKPFFPDLPECCGSGRCEVCTPGYDWGRDG